MNCNIFTFSEFFHSFDAVSYFIYPAYFFPTLNIKNIEPCGHSDTDKATSTTELTAATTRTTQARTNFDLTQFSQNPNHK